ncbi:hypothetical protein NC651_015868 [Populus alba x Populus x berolinensis]|nr:hypothetical protein NC651_015868 [Populus alba x Populus x berolinensis]
MATTSSSSHGAWTSLKSTCVEITTASFGSGSPECRDVISWVATAAPLVVSHPKTILTWLLVIIFNRAICLPASMNLFPSRVRQLNLRTAPEPLFPSMNLEKKNRDRDSKIFKDKKHKVKKNEDIIVCGRCTK